MKPKIYRSGSKKKSNNYDCCQTPFYALDPLLPYLPKGTIWEPAAGEGNIITKLKLSGRTDVVWGDILTGQNFFEDEPPKYDCQVTNPPYSLKYEWLTRSYELGKPFALLLPLEALGASSGQVLFDKYGIELILLSKRINFKMPNKGYDTGGAQFPTAWFTYGLKIGQQLTFKKITYYSDAQFPLFDSNDQTESMEQLPIKII